MVFVCPVTKLLNTQVIEGKSAIVEGLTRLSCEVGLPSMILADRESSILKVLREAEISLRNLHLVMKKEHGVKFQVAPVAATIFMCWWREREG